MAIGLGVVLLVLGAIFTFALEVGIPGLGEDALGLILMAAGVLSIVLGFFQLHSRQHQHHVVEDRVAPARGRTTVTEERI